MSGDRIPCINPRCRRTGGAKYGPGAEIICGKCFRALPDALRERYRKFHRGERRMLRLVSKRVARQSIAAHVVDRIHDSMRKRGEAIWQDIRRRFTAPETPAGLGIALTVRAVLPNRRPAETFDFQHAIDASVKPMRYTATVGRGSKGEVCEVFLNCSKIGSGADANARDAAIAVSIGLQHGVPIETLRGAVTRNGDGSPSSPIGKLLDMLEQRE